MTLSILEMFSVMSFLFLVVYGKCSPTWENHPKNSSLMHWRRDEKTNLLSCPVAQVVQPPLTDLEVPKERRELDLMDVFF